MNKPFLKERDGWNRRLLLFIQKKTGLAFTEIKQLKKGIWLLSTRKGHLIVKEFPTTAKLKVQAALTKELHNHGFSQTYNIYSKPLILDNRIFALIEYIDSKPLSTFRYDQTSNILEAIELLAKFHHTTSRFVSSYEGEIPTFFQLRKWEIRQHHFNQSLYLHTPLRSHLRKFAEIGKWAMEIMREEEEFFLQSPHCIIHGDVASHNIIRAKNNRLYLIDFDLIGIAPHYIDLIQLSNRVLPFFDWEEKELFRFKELRKYQHIRPFLAAIVYPADIYREWLHFMSSNDRKKKWPVIEKLVLEQYKLRIQFSERIKEIIDSP